MVAVWGDLAQQLLDAAVDSGVTVDREFIAPGPNFARDCSLIAVVLLRPSVVPLRREWAGACAVAPQHDFQIVYVEDCVPVPDDSGAPPSPSAVSTWAKSYLDHCNAIHDAVLTAVYDGSIAGGCHQISVGQGDMRGPQGQTASMVLPITITLVDE